MRILIDRGGSDTAEHTVFAAASQDLPLNVLSKARRGRPSCLGGRFSAYRRARL